MRSTRDAGSPFTPTTGPMRRLGPRVAAVAVAVALAPSAYAVSSAQGAHSSGGPTAVSAKKKPKKKCRKGFKLNKHGKCVSSSSPVY